MVDEDSSLDSGAPVFVLCSCCEELLAKKDSP